MQILTWFQRNKKSSFTILFLFLTTSACFFITVGTGPVSISPSTVVRILIHSSGIGSSETELSQFATIVTAIRLPRAIMAVLVGATLAVSGAALQGLFRNPLADPTLIGVSSGSALFAAIVIISGSSLLTLLPDFIGNYLLQIAAFIGGLTATFLVYFISTKNGTTSVTTMLLAGIAINALTAAGIGFLVFTADDIQIRDLTFWTLGSLGSSTWNTVYSTAPILLICILGLPLLAGSMNVLLLGEHEARHLGVHTQRVKKLVIVLAALGVGSAVSVTGIIGFVGLVVPHLLRLLIGPDHRFLLPGSVFLGALLLLLSDLFARMVVIPAELPIGIITSAIGAPFFLWLLLRKRNILSLT